VDQHEGQHRADHEQPGAPLHRAPERVGQLGLLLVAATGETDQQRQRRHREQAAGPGRGVVEAAGPAQQQQTDRGDHRPDGQR
jgi:hypothetical protein